MGEKKHIDRFFQEHFKDFEANPKDAVWEKIEAQLNQKKKKRKVIPIWWWYGGVAALLLLFMSLGYQFLNNDSDEIVNPTIVNSEKEIKKVEELIENSNNVVAPKVNSIVADSNSLEANTKNKSTKNKLTSKSQTTIAQDNLNPLTEEKTVNISIVKRTEIQNSKGTSKIANKNKESEKLEVQNDTVLNLNKARLESLINQKPNTKIASSTVNKEKPAEEILDSAVVAKTKDNKQSIEEAIQNNTDVLKDETTQIAQNKWSISPNIAPVYFSSLGEGSSIDPQFNSNSKSGEINMSYGLNASYALNNKLKVRAGINRVNLGYATNDVLAFSSVNSNTGINSSFLSNSGNSENFSDDLALGTEVVGNLKVISASTFRSGDFNSLETIDTSINESFGFIEIPLELQYTISEKRLGINIIGGFSSLFLNNYQASSVINGQVFTLQQNNSVNNTSYSANFGFGLDYKFSKKINLNIEPMFKYQINTFRNASGDFQPFFIGVYTGFGIKF